MCRIPPALLAHMRLLCLLAHMRLLRLLAHMRLLYLLVRCGAGITAAAPTRRIWVRTHVAFLGLPAATAFIDSGGHVWRSLFRQRFALERSGDLNLHGLAGSYMRR